MGMTGKRAERRSVAPGMTGKRAEPRSVTLGMTRVLGPQASHPQDKARQGPAIGAAKPLRLTKGGRAGENETKLS